MAVGDGPDRTWPGTAEIDRVGYEVARQCGVGAIAVKNAQNVGFDTVA